jgi:hypothetical protein
VQLQEGDLFWSEGVCTWVLEDNGDLEEQAETDKISTLILTVEP